jgi:translation initiation factor 3 subunit F
MYSLESITLNDSSLPTVQVSLSVVFNILNAFNRRSENSPRIVGTLLGEVKDNIVNITDCFVVPFVENAEEVTVSINAEYHKAMYNFHRRNNKKEQIVGWFSTSSLTGSLVTDNCWLVHNFYATQCTHQPVHLVVDTTLASADGLMSVRCFVARDNILGAESLNVAFHELKTTVAPASDAEATLVHQLVRGQRASRKFSSATVHAPLSNPVVSAADAGVNQVRKSTEALLEVISGLQQYVEMVQEGKVDAHRDVGILINEAIALYGTQSLQPAQLSTLQTRAQDLLMAAYLASSVRVQTTLAERVNEIL